MTVKRYEDDMELNVGDYVVPDYAFVNGFAGRGGKVIAVLPKSVRVSELVDPPREKLLRKNNLKFVCSSAEEANKVTAASTNLWKIESEHEQTYRKEKAERRRSVIEAMLVFLNKDE